MNHSSIRFSPVAIGNRSVAPRRSVKIFWLTGFLVWAAAPTLALGLAADGPQVPSRAALLKKEREAKQTVLVSPERTPAERGLNKIQKSLTFLENITGSWRGFHFTSGHFPAGAGFGYGLGYTQEAVGSRYAERNLPNRVGLNLVAASSSRQYYRAGFDLAFRNIGGSFINMGLRGQSIEFPEEDYFGLGPDSVEEHPSRPAATSRPRSRTGQGTGDSPQGRLGPIRRCWLSVRGCSHKYVPCSFSTMEGTGCSNSPGPVRRSRRSGHREATLKE